MSGISKWRKTRKMVIARSGGWCEECGKFRAEHVHHKQYWPDGGKGGEPLEWLVHLCLLCHGEKHPHLKFYPGWRQREIAKERGRGRKERTKPKKKKVGTRKTTTKQRKKSRLWQPPEDHTAKLAETTNWDLRQKILGGDYWGRAS